MQNNSENKVHKTCQDTQKNSNITVKCDCYNGGKVLELLKKHHTKVWDFSCEKGALNFACAGVSSDAICKIISKCGGENVEICEIGRFAKLKKAMPILLGVVVFFAVIFISNLFVLKVEVYGEDEILQVHIENLASEIYPLGAVKTNEKLSQLKAEIASCEDVAFFTVEIYQNTLIINFLKAENAEIISAKSSVVAPESGTLISLLTLSGTAVKSAGDYVEKGEDLILAYVGGETPKEIEKAVGSGVMMAEKTASFTISQIYTQKTYSGNSQTDTYYIINGVEVFKAESNFEYCDISSVTTEYLSPNIQVVKETRLEYFQSQVVLTPNDACENAVGIFKSRYLTDFAYTITNVKTSIETDGEAFKVDVTCEYLLQFS